MKSKILNFAWGCGMWDSVPSLIWLWLSLGKGIHLLLRSEIKGIQLSGLSGGLVLRVNPNGHCWTSVWITATYMGSNPLAVMLRPQWWNDNSTIIIATCMVPESDHCLFAAGRLWLFIWLVLKALHWLPNWALTNGVKPPSGKGRTTLWCFQMASWFFPPLFLV